MREAPASLGAFHMVISVEGSSLPRGRRRRTALVTTCSPAASAFALSSFHIWRRRASACRSGFKHPSAPTCAPGDQWPRPTKPSPMVEIETFNS